MVAVDGIILYGFTHVVGECFTYSHIIVAFSATVICFEYRDYRMVSDEIIDDRESNDGSGTSQPTRRRVLRGIAAVGFGFTGIGVDSGSVAVSRSTTDCESSGSTDSAVTGCLVVRGANCGTPTNSATVNCRPKSPLVFVSGTISGEDACKTAVLQTAAYTPETEILDVVIATENKNPTEQPCSMCIYEIDYDAFFTLQECAPAMVVVHHQSVTGTTVVARESCNR